jgi:nucleotide-binding universal stress UspA family protein
METLLIATDFSSAARNATMYGFELARKMQAKVVLFTAYQTKATLPDSSLYLTTNEMERSMYKQLLCEAETTDLNRTVLLETKCINGPINNSILAVALMNKASYIITGMKERGKEIRKLFGSTVTDLIKTSQTPLIVVPENAVFSIPKTIALASDVTDNTDVHIFNPLKKIAQSFNSKVCVVTVVSNAKDREIETVRSSDKFNSSLLGLNPEFKFIEGEDVATALNAFVSDSDVDMLSVIPHEHTLLNRIFITSVTKELVFRTHVPLLILPFKKSTTSTIFTRSVYNSDMVESVY